MSTEERSIQKNKLIIAVATLVFLFLIVGVILLKSNLNDTFYFHYIHSRKTGDSLGFFTSIILYIMLGGVLGLVPSSIVFLFSLSLYEFLHRKNRFLHLSPHPKCEEEMHFGGCVAFISSYTATFILMILHICNIVTINVF